MRQTYYGSRRLYRRQLSSGDVQEGGASTTSATTYDGADTPRAATTDGRSSGLEDHTAHR